MCTTCRPARSSACARESTSITSKGSISAARRAVRDFWPAVVLLLPWSFSDGAADSIESAAPSEKDHGRRRTTAGQKSLTARRAAEIEPFEVMDVLSRAHALERAGRHVVHMEIGEPDFTAPAPVVEAGVRALREGRTAYTATLGLPALRAAIAAHYADRFATPLDASRVVVTSGASGGLLSVVAVYVDPGDEVLVPDPGYPGYRHFVRAFEGRARALAVSPAENFQPTLEMVRAAWGPRTKGLLLGSPSNPTGTLIPKDELRAIAGFIAERGGVLMVDEIYQGLTYGVQPWTALGLPGEVVIVNRFSKYF